jgi:hypothetical protein
MKNPKWLQWRSGEKSSASKSENLDNMRRHTDQKMKNQEAQKIRQDDAKKTN